MIGQHLLDYIGGVGAQHDQFAMGHIDHTHDTEGDRQPRGHQQQYRSQAETKKELFQKTVEFDLAFNTAANLLGALDHTLILFQVFALVIGAQQVVHRIAHGGFQAALHNVECGQSNRLLVALDVIQCQRQVDKLNYLAAVFLLARFEQQRLVIRVGVFDHTAHRLGTLFTGLAEQCQTGDYLA